MGNQKIRHLVAKPQKGGHTLFYWQPARALRATGLFFPRRLAERTGLLRDAIMEAEILNAEVDAWRAGVTIDPVRHGTIPWLVKVYRSESIYLDAAEKTRYEYDLCIKTIEKWSASVGHPAVAGIDRPAVRRFAQELAATPSKARAVMAVLRILLGVAIEEGLITVNPAKSLRLKKAKARQTIWTDDQVNVFCAKAAELERPSMALAVRLAANLGQREGDILPLGWAQWDGVKMRVRQRKTGKLVEVPATADLLSTLAEAAKAKTSPSIVISEVTGRPYKGDHFRHEFARIREEAKLSDGLWFMDLRRTAVVRLAEAGCTPPEISAITGHDLDTTMAILEVYLPRTLPMAQAAIAKLDEHRKRTKLEG